MIIIFVSDPGRVEKNFRLAEEAIRMVNNPEIELYTVHNKNQTELVNFYNAADLLVLPSYHEGSPNVIKEAMACNCPIVSTDVGDVKWVIGETEGCYIASFEPENFAEKVKLALEFSPKVWENQGKAKNY